MRLSWCAAFSELAYVKQLCRTRTTNTTESHRCNFVCDTLLYWYAAYQSTFVVQAAEKAGLKEKKQLCEVAQIVGKNLKHAVKTIYDVM